MSKGHRGLAYTVDINPNDSMARDVAERIKRGDVSGSSFAFTIAEEDEL